MNAPLRILIVEDSENDTLLLLRQLKRGGYEVVHERVETAEAMATALAKQEWDLVISDYNMPHFSGPAALAQLRATGRDIPFILVSRAIGEEKAVASLKAGAHDFVSKDNLARLLPAIERELGQERDRRERQRESEEWIRLLLESMAEAVFGIDLQGNCTFCNPACLRMLGYPGDSELLGKNMHALIHSKRPDGTPCRVEECGVDQAFRRDEGSHAEDQLFWKADGTSFPVEYWSYPARRSGSVVGVVVTFLDISERRLLESQFRQAQKLEAVGRLAGGVAHDFNNILGVIYGYSDLLLRRLKKNGADEKELGFLKEISEASQRAAGLTRQLLAFSRKQVLQVKVVNLKDLVADFEKMLRRLLGEDIDLLVRSDPDLWRVKVDTGQMEQVLMNLAVNARDAMPTGGKLTIEIGNVDLGPDYAESHPYVPAGQYVRLAVSDTGCGISLEDQGKIFEPFFTTKGPEKGTGLGLSVVFGIVKQSGGHIEVYSELGIGTTFKIYVPRCEQDKPLVCVQATARPVPGGGETILLVEDDDCLRVMARMMIEEQGYKVLVASRGPEALQMTRQHAGPIDLLVSDVVMPQMSGRQLAEQLAAVRPKMRVLYLSGYTGEAMAHHGILEAGAELLQKPFTPEGLARRIRDVLDKGRA